MKSCPTTQQLLIELTWCHIPKLHMSRCCMLTPLQSTLDFRQQFLTSCSWTVVQELEKSNEPLSKLISQTGTYPPL